mmetsp:Transcript_39648/g.85547  ORF Transcript_39648/g.85547 Transcript_39648/m.85547 type:complete len:580 (+) Transcript_39648:119-1858(+)
MATSQSSSSSSSYCSNDSIGSTNTSANNNMANTLLLDINSLLHDEDISDITLVPEPSTSNENSSNNNDPVTAVPAIKAILAARSPVFRRMLYGEFRETHGAENVEVKLDYSGRVLQLLVEFIFTDKLDSLNIASNGVVGNSSNNSSTATNSGGGGSCTAAATSSCTLEEKARLLTNLSGAAHYFDIPKLESDIKTKLNAMMLEHPSLACAILDESSKMLSGEELVLLAMERVRARPKAALLHWNKGVPPSSLAGTMNGAGISSTFPSIGSGNNSTTAGGDGSGEERGGVTSLNASLLEQVIFDDQSTASELTKFLCLKKWVEGCKHVVSSDDIDVPRKMLDTDEILSSRTPSKPARKLIDDAMPAATAQPNVTPPPSPTSKSPSDESSIVSQQQHRLTIAKHLAEKLDLSLIPASDLSTTITDSKLISTHDLYQAYRLQALNAERTKSKVFVEGAGLGEVNGTYIQRGVHEGTPMYNKEGVWRDREEVFRIFLCTYSNGNKSWCLSIVPKGKEPGKTTDLDFYECPVSYGKGGGITGGSYGGSAENGLGVVPSRGWKLVNYGQPPVPKCSLIVGCLEDA